MTTQDSMFHVYMPFFFQVNGISVLEKKKKNPSNIEIWLSTHAIKIWDHLNEN